MPPRISLGKSSAKCFRRAFERFGEALARLAIELLNRMGQILDRGLQIGALGVERRRALLEFLDLALGREINLADALRLGAQLRQASYRRARSRVRRARARVRRASRRTRLEFLGEVTSELFAERACALASERALERCRVRAPRACRPRSQRLAQSVRAPPHAASHAARNSAVAASSSASAQATPPDPARRVVEISRSNSTRSSPQRASAVRSFADLRFQLVARAAKMRQLLLHRSEPSRRASTLRGRLEHRGAGFLRRGASCARSSRHGPRRGARVPTASPMRAGLPAARWLRPMSRPDFLARRPRACSCWPRAAVHTSLATRSRPAPLDCTRVRPRAACRAVGEFAMRACSRASRACFEGRASATRCSASACIDDSLRVSSSDERRAPTFGSRRPAPRLLPPPMILPGDTTSPSRVTKSVP